MGPAGVVTGLIEEVHVVDIVLHGVDHLERLAVGEVAVVLDADLAVLAAVLGGHKDNTVSTPVTVDGAGGSVLKDGDVGDVSGVDRVDALLDTVHEHEGTGGVEGSDTTDVHGDSLVTRHTATLHNLQTRRCIGEGLGSVDDRTGLGCYLVEIDSGDRTGQVDLLLYAVSDDNRFLKGEGVLFHGHCNLCAAVDRNFNRSVTKIGDYDCPIGGHIVQRCRSILVGHGAVGRSLDHDSDSWESTHVVFDNCGHRDPVRLLGAGFERTKTEQEKQRKNREES